MLQENSKILSIVIPVFNELLGDSLNNEIAILPIIIKVDNTILPKLIDSTVFDLKKIKRTDNTYDIVPVKSKNFSVWKKYEGTKISRWIRKINKTA